MILSKRTTCSYLEVCRCHAEYFPATLARAVGELLRSCPNAAMQYRPAVTTSRARIPKTKDVFSSNPPATAPSIFEAKAALGDPAALNSEANRMPAKKIGIEKMTVETKPCTTGLAISL